MGKAEPGFELDEGFWFIPRYLCEWIPGLQKLEVTQGLKSWQKSGTTYHIVLCMLMFSTS